MNEEIERESDGEYDGWDMESSEIDSEDEDDTPKKPKAAKKVERDPLPYENNDMVYAFDCLVESVKGDKKSNQYRDHFFPSLIDAMELKTGIEIGVDKAEFSLHILNKSKISSYYCVDTWQDDFGSNCRPGFFDKNGDKRFSEAQKALQLFIDNRRVTMVRKTSVEASKDFADGFFDYCYIDGDHSLEGILDDLRAWTPKVRVGGVIAGHDYKDGPRSGINDFFKRQLDYKIKTVADNFCARHGYPLRVVGGRILSWYFMKNRNM